MKKHLCSHFFTTNGHGSKKVTVITLHCRWFLQKCEIFISETGLPAAPLRATVVVCSSISLYSSIDAASDKSLAVLGIVSIQIQCDV